MAVTVSFIYEKNGELVETIHSTLTNDFTRDDLLVKFQSFMESLGYVFPKEDEECKDGCTQQTANFDLE